MAILVISPHPDDDVIGMGGTIARYVTNKERVSCVYITNGARSPRSFDITDEGMARKRRSEARTAALEILGMSTIYFLQPIHVTHETFDKSGMERLQTKLRKIILTEMPQEIYLPHQREAHRTHKIVHDLSLDLLTGIPQLTPIVWGYEVWTPIENPSLVVDVTSFIEKKVAAIQAHRTQLVDKSYIEGTLGLNRYRAVFKDPYQVDSAMYAEAFARLT